ncbi:MAG: hypothetical protein WD058_02620, partial [Dehalococcoidia bacterium]
DPGAPDGSRRRVVHTGVAARRPTMVAGSPEQLREDAKALYERSDLPESFAFLERLSTVNQRLFARDLWPVLASAYLEPTDPNLREFVEFIEGWAATADLDADKEASAEMRRPATYQPFRVA